MVKSGKLEKALHLYQECIETGKKDRQYLQAILFNRGVVYGKMSKLDDAITDMNEVLKLNPLHVKALVKRGDFQF